MCSEVALQSSREQGAVREEILGVTDLMVLLLVQQVVLQLVQQVVR